MIEPSHEGETHSLEAALQVFVNARRWDATRRVLEAQRDVPLSDAAMDVLRANVDERRAAGQEDAAAHLERHLRLLEWARKEGIDAAFQALARELDEDQGDEDYIPPELHEILRRLESLTRVEDMPSRIALLEQALTPVQRASQPVLWAVLQGELGNALADRARVLIGQARCTALEAAITCYDAALLERRREVVPFDWAMTQNNKGAALADLAELLSGEARAATLRDAIACNDAALLERRREVVPVDWAATQGDKSDALQVPRDLGPSQSRATGTVDITTELMCAKSST